MPFPAPVGPKVAKREQNALKVANGGHKLSNRQKMQKLLGEAIWQFTHPTPRFRQMDPQIKSRPSPPCLAGRLGKSPGSWL